jgi:hypothetical protein
MVARFPGSRGKFGGNAGRSIAAGMARRARYEAPGGSDGLLAGLFPSAPEPLHGLRGA